MIKTREKRIELFWSKTVRSGDCILWTGGKNQYGYGRFWTGEKTVCAHRFAWELTNGPMPAHLLGMHSCDTPACVNPSHITPGTPLENMRDASRKGRFPRTNPKRQNYGFKITREQAVEIRLKFASGVTQKELAAKYDISMSMVSHITANRAWRYAGGPTQTDLPRGRRRTVNPQRAEAVLRRARAR